ncbi:hypothetical protein C8035_v005665 [Colletotrichum spinosum]|uniref:Transmembrane protein n=1 Tax=Colletotrichum spinosum TaxID=1347390 RepID=A0A4V6QEL3_9PEZI|nr:hypothetical protein C8035_v005665 [Colletotrichum spinosum]
MPAVSHPELVLEEPPSSARSHHQLLQSHVCIALAFLALLVILRFVAHVVFPSSSKNEDGITSRQTGSVSNDLDRLVKQQRLHRLFFPEGSWTMDEGSRGVSSNAQNAGDEGFSRKLSPHAYYQAEKEMAMFDGKSSEKQETSSPPHGFFGAQSITDVTSSRIVLSRPPPPPPLTPPELSPSVFTYDDRRRSFTGLATELDASFFEQPNPDYMSSTETATTTATRPSQSTRSSPAPRRRSYTRTLPVGVPASSASPVSDGSATTFSPSSFPPTSPLLPGPPPIHGEILEDGTLRHVEVHGEIISMLDDNGFGWKRHTRVFGGGVCLACAASGHDGHHGGFYGENVLPEEKRY